MQNSLADLVAAGVRLREARDAAEEALTNARELALSALEEGAKEAAVARALGVHRMTIRTWAGK